MTDITLKKYDEVYMKVSCEPSIARELSDIFTFKVPGYQFHPSYRARYWDGNIRLFSPKTGLLYEGLLNYVKDFADERDYTIEVDEEIDTQTEFSLHEAEQFIKTLKLPKKIELRDYQLESFVHCIRSNRSLFISPTGSGKSLIIYWLIRYYNVRTLIIVDRINLVNQMYSDFEEYGFDVENNMHKIYSGHDKNTNKQIVITTWQSIARLGPGWYNQFELVIGDEAHKYKATSLKRILENMPKCKYRFGMTGSLDGSQTNQLVLEGLFGSYTKIVSTKDLIDMGHLAELEIKILHLKYSDEDCKLAKGKKYNEEIDFINEHKHRNRFIKNLALSLKGNTLVLFQRVEKHGEPLYEAIKEEANVPTYFIAGKVDGDDREEIRKIVNTHENSITCASVGTFSEGVNIPNINNIIIASPTKSMVRTLQSIGRGLRKSDVKEHCVVFDIVDDLAWKRRQNFTLKHFLERLTIYAKEQFVYKIYKLQLK